MISHHCSGPCCFRSVLLPLSLSLWLNILSCFRVHLWYTGHCWGVVAAAPPVLPFSVHVEFLYSSRVTLSTNQTVNSWWSPLNRKLLRYTVAIFRTRILWATRTIASRSPLLNREPNTSSWMLVVRSLFLPAVSSCLAHVITATTTTAINKTA